MAPSRATDHSPVALVAAQVDHRRRRARAARRRRGRGRRRARMCSGTSSSAARVGAAGDVRAGLQHRPAHVGAARASAGGQRGHPQAERRRVGPAGQREAAAPGWAAAASRRRAAARRSAPARPRAELGQRRQRELEGEEHHRRGLVRRAALEHVEPLDGLLGRRARRPARRRCRPGRRRRRRPRCSARRSAASAGASSPRGHHPLDARRGRAALGAREARGARELLDGERLAVADLEREEAGAALAGLRHQPADDVEPVEPGEQRARRLVARDLGRQRARRPRRRAGWRRRRRPRPRRRAGRRCTNATSSPSRARVGARHGERVRADVGRRDARSGRSSLSASATAPLPVPTSTTRAPCGSVERRLDERARSPAAGSARAGRRAARGGGSP